MQIERRVKSRVWRENSSCRGGANRRGPASIGLRMQNRGFCRKKRMVLEKLGGDPKQVIDQLDLGENITLFAPFICPFRIIFIVSSPASVRRTLSKEKKPRPGLVQRLIKRWSCSIKLFRYLTCAVHILAGVVGWF